MVVLGLLASVSPSTLIAFAALLASGRPKRNAVAFLVGWNISLIIVFTLCYGASKSTLSTLHTDGHVVTCVVEVVLGVTFAGLAARTWWGGGRQQRPGHARTRLSTDVADLHPWQAAILGVIEQPWTLTALAAVVIVSHKAGPLAVFVAFVLFSALSTSTVITMFGYFSRRPDEADHRLAEIKARLARSGPVAAAIVSALVAAVLLADGIFGLIRN